MPRTIKIVTLRDRTYSIRQMNAVDGSMLLQKMQAEIYKYMGSFDDLTARLTKYRGLRVAGWSLAFGGLMEAITVPLYARGKPKIPEEEQEARELELIADTINGMLSDVTFQGSPINLQEHFEGRYEELAVLLVHVFQHNFLGVWRERFYLPEDYDSGVSTPKSVERAQEAYTQSSLVYTVITSELASFADLHTLFNTAELYDLYETVCRKNFEAMEFQKQAQREAAQQSR